MTKLDAYIGDALIGKLSENSKRETVFTYDAEYVASNRHPLSLSLPFGTVSNPKTVDNYLENLLTENSSRRRDLKLEYGVRRNKAVDILEHMGEDLAGALSIVPANESLNFKKAKKLSQNQFIKKIKAVQGNETGRNSYAGRQSIAGFQNKCGLYKADGVWHIPTASQKSNHILKPDPKEKRDMLKGTSIAINEYVCMNAIASCIPAAKTELLELPGVGYVLDNSRFDHMVDERGEQRLFHQEDMCQALGLPPSMKYQNDGAAKGKGNGISIADIADVLDTLNPINANKSRVGFFKALVLNAALYNNDAHAKNYSLLYGNISARLSPQYDVTSCYLFGSETQLLRNKFEASMKIGITYKFNDIKDSDWLIVARALKIRPEPALEIKHDMEQKLLKALKDFSHEDPKVQAYTRVIARGVESYIEAYQQLPSAQKKVWKDFVEYRDSCLNS